jgi:signal peptide peptidase SppA
MSQRFPRLAAHVFNRAHWATPRFAENVAAVLMGRMAGTTINNVVMATAGEIERQPVRAPQQTANGIRVIPVVGGLAHRGDSFDAECYGMQSYTNLHNELVAAMNDRDVRAILLDIDSPGGEVGGCFELADMILDMRKDKPIFGVANACAASAAYALGSSCSKLFCTPSGEVGSIGVVWLHVDVSKNLEAQGIATTFVYAGKHKVDGNPFEPLSKADREAFQAEIDQSYSQFVALVAARRPMSTEAIRETEARCFRADEAVKLGLVDGVASFQGALAALDSELNQARAPGVVKMENPTMSTPAPAAPAAVDNTAALEAARADGYKAGRVDAGKIMGSAEAKDRPTLAAKFAGDPAMSVEAATGYLADSPTEAKGGKLAAAMEKHAPVVDSGSEQSPDAARKAELAGVAKAASGRYRHA